MTSEELENKISSLGVSLNNIPNLLRAAIYFEYLEKTADFFNEKEFSEAMRKKISNKEGSDKHYSLVKKAVTSSNLLEELANVLDYYLGAAISHDLEKYINEKKSNKEESLKKYLYEDYFDERIFKEYSKNVEEFKNDFSVIKHVMKKVTENFQQNILTACVRVVQDYSDIQKFFKGPLFEGDEAEILEWRNELKQIKSTGSDSHKGGQQVLILTFPVLWSPNGFLEVLDLELVYKPSDVEVDCLLIGRSEAVKKADPEFKIEASLTEIINRQIRKEKEKNQQSPLELLPTYRILPREYTSGKKPEEMPSSLRNAYGYIEFLDYRKPYERSPVSSYSYGRGDYLIYGWMEKKSIIEKFYRQLGQWLAIAATFSIKDMHMENMRVRRYQPYLIDLEVSLTTPIKNLKNTNFFDEKTGAITGEEIDTKFVWEVRDIDNEPCLLLASAPSSRLENRLRTKEHDKSEKIVAVDTQQLLIGLDKSMDLLAQASRDNAFNAWFDRLNGVLVRVLPYATQVFIDVMKDVFVDTYGISKRKEKSIKEIIKEVINETRTIKYNEEKTTGDQLPKYLVLQPSIEDDFENLDIPVFYHRLGTLDLLDSHGNRVSIPETIDVLPEKDKNQDKVEKKEINIERKTYYLDNPIEIVMEHVKKLADNNDLVKRRTDLIENLLILLKEESFLELLTPRRAPATSNNKHTGQ